MKSAWLYIVFIFVVLGCKTSVEESKSLIVKVGNEKLFLEDFQDMIPRNLSPADSTEVVNNLIDKWVKETLFMNQAKKKVDRSTIDPLVDSYQNSLFVHNYESMLVNEGLDTIVGDREVDQYYKLHRLDFILAEPAYLMYMALIPYEDKKDFVDKWKEEEWEEIEESCKLNRYWHHLSDSLWVTKNDIFEYLPQEIAEEVKLKKGFYKSEKRDSMYYLIEVQNYLKPGKEAPKSIVRKQIEKLILHKRTRKLLEEEKTKLYEDAISKSSIIKYSEK